VAVRGAVPGPELRVGEGETLRISLENGLSEGTTIHWHGVPVPNPMDGVPDVTQAPVSSDETFEYEYEASPAGRMFTTATSGYNSTGDSTGR